MLGEGGEEYYEREFKDKIRIHNENKIKIRERVKEKYVKIDNSLCPLIFIE